MAKRKSGYLNAHLGWLINLIFAIIPFTSWLLGGITRIMRGHLIAGILQLLLIGEVIFYFVDLVTVIIAGDLTIFA